MQKIIVTGGLGFIGSNLIELLLKINYFVINIDKVSYSSNFYNVKDFKNNKKYKFAKCDLTNKKKFKLLYISINQIVFLILLQRRMLTDLLMVLIVLLIVIF